MNRRSACVRAFFALAPIGAAVLGAVGCSATSLPPGATAPADGAPGACCPASTGGCAYVGGYSATGDCPPRICDNMCAQRIVDDEHGCKKMVYSTPSVETTYAGTESCGSAIFNGQRDAGDAGPDASDAGGSCEDQGAVCLANGPDSGIGPSGVCPAGYVNVLPDPCPSVNQHCCRPVADGG